MLMFNYNASTCSVYSPQFAHISTKLLTDLVAKSVVHGWLHNIKCIVLLFVR